MADSKKDKDKSNNSDSAVPVKDKEVESTNQNVPNQSFVSSEVKKSKPNITIYAVAIIVIILIFVVVLVAGGKHKSATHAVSTDSWTGKGTTNKWSDSANWTNGVPEKDYNLIFGTTPQTADSSNTTSDNNLGNITYNSIVFKSGNKTTYQPFEITGDAVNVGSGGIILDSTNAISINKLELSTATSITGQTKMPAILTANIDLNSNALGISDSLVNLNGLSGSGNVTVNAEGFLDFNQEDTSNPSYSGNISVLSTAEITINPEYKDLGTGSLAIANSGKLVFKLTRSATFSNALVLGGTGNVNSLPYVDATSDVLSKDAVTGLTLTFNGNITLNNDASLNTSVSGNNLEPVQYVIMHKPSGKYKLEAGTGNVNITQQ
jgi:hypothetical protein